MSLRIAVPVLSLLACAVPIQAEVPASKPFSVADERIADVLEQLPNKVVARTIQVTGKSREYHVYAPEHVEPLPVVLILHGSGGKADFLFEHFAPQAEQRKFIAVWPTGVSFKLQDFFKGGKLDEEKLLNLMKDELEFLRTVATEAVKRNNGDPSRVSAVGFSFGGVACHLLAAEASDIFAAVVPVISSMPTAIGASFEPKHPVSLLCIKGDADPILPVGGRDGWPILPLTSMLEEYRKVNEITGTPTITQIADKDVSDKTSARIERYQPGKDGFKVELLLVKGGGHLAYSLLPPKIADARSRMAGPDCRDFYMPDIIWEFLRNCPPRSSLPASADN